MIRIELKQILSDVQTLLETEDPSQRPYESKYVASDRLKDFIEARLGSRADSGFPPSWYSEVEAALSCLRGIVLAQTDLTSEAHTLLASNLPVLTSYESRRWTGLLQKALNQVAFLTFAFDDVESTMECLREVTVFPLPTTVHDDDHARARMQHSPLSRIFPLPRIYVPGSRHLFYLQSRNADCAGVAAAIGREPLVLVVVALLFVAVPQPLWR